MAVTTPPGRHYTPWCVKCNSARVLRIISIMVTAWFLSLSTLCVASHLYCDSLKNVETAGAHQIKKIEIQSHQS